MEAAFEAALVDGVREAAWRYCCRLTASVADAEDLLQESLAHGFVRFRGLRDQTAFKPWLLAIIRSRFLMAVRRRKLIVVPEIELVAQLDSAPTAWADEVREGLRRLPQAQREALELLYLEGLTLAELGRVLGVPTVAARHRLHRARGALRRVVLGAATLSAKTKLEELP